MGSYVMAYCDGASAGHSRILRALEVEGGVRVGIMSAEVLARRACGAYEMAFCDAAANGHTMIMRALMEEGGVDVNSHPEAGRSALQNAARSGNVEAVKMLVTVWGANVNQLVTLEDLHSYVTPLYIAAEQGHVKLARMLIHVLHADVHKTRTDIGATPLHIAARNGHTGLARMLVVEGQAGVNEPNADYGETPLHIAAWHGQTDMTHMLVVEGKARINQCDNDGRRPLHDAAQRGHRDTCFALCVLGANMDLSVPGGEPPLVIDDEPLADWITAVRCRPYYGTPLKIAIERRDHATMVRLLRSQLTSRPTAKMVREELMPIASRVGMHALARPVCEQTRRVASVAVELYSGKWKHPLHQMYALCGKEQREAIMAVMIIMKRARVRVRADPKPARAIHCPATRALLARRAHVRVASGRATVPWGGLVRDDAQPGGLPGWMHGVVDDVWWKVLEMMGGW